MPNPADSKGHRERLRQRFERTGFAGFAEHEVVELLLTLCIPRHDVKQPAKALLARFGNLRAILDAPADDLREVAGIGTVAPIALRVIREAASLYLEQTAETTDALDNTNKIEAFWLSRLGGLNKEVFEIAYLDRSLRLMKNGVERLEEGTVDQAFVHPRKVMEAALKRSASGIIIAHNHPTGRAQASSSDIEITQALEKAAGALQIFLLDHLIIARDKVFSFRREGLL